MVNTCHYTSVQTHKMYTPRANPIVNRGLWVIMMCLSRFISFNKCYSLVGDVDSGKAMHVWSQSIWEISESSQFYCEPKTTLKNI